MFPIYDEVYEFSALLGILDRQIAKSFPLENDVFMKVKSMLTHLFSSDFPWLFLEIERSHDSSLSAGHPELRRPTHDNVVSRAVSSIPNYSHIHLERQGFCTSLG